MSEITPAYRPFESFCNPSAPDEAFTTSYPLRSSAARKNAVTDGSSSMSRIVNEKVAMVADYHGLIKVMMNFAVGNVCDFPGERRRPGDVHFVGAIEKVWFGAVVGGIEKADAVGDEGVAVIIGSELLRGDGPEAAGV